MRLLVTMTALLALTGCATDAAARRPVTPVADATAGDIFHGKQVALQSCGGCHAIDHGPSPLRGAPPFTDLYRRYPAGGLAQLLEEGMILPSDRIQEEGTRYSHPRMPAVQLGPDEVTALTAYLRSLEPKR